MLKNRATARPTPSEREEEVEEAFGAQPPCPCATSSTLAETSCASASVPCGALGERSRPGRLIWAWPGLSAHAKGDRRRMERYAAVRIEWASSGARERWRRAATFARGWGARVSWRLTPVATPVGAAASRSWRDERLPVAAAAEQPGEHLADGVATPRRPADLRVAPAVGGGGGLIARDEVGERVVPGQDVEHRAEHDGEHDEDGGGDEPKVPVLVVLLEVGQQRRHGQRDHAHQLDEDVERRAGRVLERVPHRVAHHARLLLLPPRRVFGLFEAELLAELLRVIPGAAGVGHHDRQHAARGDCARQQAHQEAGSY
mmetsp:Transcript_26505/g.85651  ORF Transcript_26505/g.85651 Transcript_26505/m.85651 type:complete len:316 (+) Transcript_26505:345-1292(+)